METSPGSVEKKTWLIELQSIAEQQAAMLDAVAEALQQAQARVPEPSRKEVQEMRGRRRPLSLPAYLRGVLQRVILNVEDAACDLRSGTEDEALAEAPSLSPTEVLLNAIEASLEKPAR